MKLAELKERLLSIELDNVARQILLYEECQAFFNQLDLTSINPDTLLSVEQQELLEFLLEKLQPRLAAPEEKIYKYLLEHLTPKLFLSQEDFDKFKNFFYTESSRGKAVDEEYYQSPYNLTSIGRLKVYAELTRIASIYQQKFARIYNEDTGSYEELLSEEIARALYLYMTNFFTKINGPLRCGGVCDCTISHFIDSINRGIERLSRVPAFQLNPDEHQLTRYIHLPEQVLQRVIRDTQSMNCFLDRAFLSTSFNKGGALSFSIDANVIIIIRSNGDCRGAKVSALSPFPSEGECLYPPGTKFECRTITSEDFNGDRKWIIHVSALSFSRATGVLMKVTEAAKKLHKPVAERRRYSSGSVFIAPSLAPGDISTHRRYTMPALLLRASAEESTTGDVERFSLPLIDKKYLK